MKRKPTETVQLKLRFLEGLRRQLEREAKRGGRSLNSEIVNRLQQTLALDDSIKAGDFAYFFRSLRDAYTIANKKDLAVGEFRSTPLPITSEHQSKSNDQQPQHNESLLDEMRELRHSLGEQRDKIKRLEQRLVDIYYGPPRPFVEGEEK